MTATDSTHDDRRAVEDVLLDYCEHVDAGDVDAVIALFTDDAVIDYGYGRHIRGRDALDEFFRERLVATYSATSHHLTNIRVTVDGDSATTRSYAYAWHARHDGSQAHVWGRYHDRLVRTGGTWRIAERAIRAAGSAGFPSADGRSPFELIDRAGRPAHAPTEPA